MEVVLDSYVMEVSFVYDFLFFDWGYFLIISEQLVYNIYVKYM